MTYENAEEQQVLQSLWRPGAPLENTIFAILDPNGRPLTPGARSPDRFFRDAHTMAQAMDDIARRYQGSGEPHSVPLVSTPKLGLNVAACDKLPLIIIVGSTEQQRAQLTEKLAPIAWSEDLIGQITYTAGSRSQLPNLSGVNRASGYLFVYPNVFGVSGEVVAQLAPDSSTEDLAATARSFVSRYHPTYLEHHEHVRLGRMQGIYWQSLLPVTDPHSPQLQQGQQRGGGWFGEPGRN